MPLTGRFNLRKTFTGRIVLVVEEETKTFWSRLTGKQKLHRRWRDANVMDLAAPELRNLVDLRFRPHYLPPLHDAPSDRPQPTMPLEVLPHGKLYYDPVEEDPRSRIAH
ncbi:MAG TPA: hypothetical protein VEZ16_13175 [Microvirga sp.]|nr:hypothetical protein [Microvirga sp.]